MVVQRHTHTGRERARAYSIVPVKQARLCTLVPAAHELHAVVLSQYLPLPHSAHTDAPSFAEYLPCSQVAQALAAVPAQRFIYATGTEV